MTSKFITPPDQLETKNSCLIINALETELAALLIWLKTVPDSYDIHLYHSRMPDTEWALAVADQCRFIAVSGIEEDYLNKELSECLIKHKNKSVRFGINHEYVDLVQIFMAKSSLDV